MTKECTCLTDTCDCQHFPTHISMECPIHNDNPLPAHTCPLHGAAAPAEKQADPSVTDIRIERLRAALERVAIVQVHRRAYGGGTVRVGYRCSLCEGESIERPVPHNAACVLAIQP